MKVAIIGASGGIGSYIRDEALARGHQVTAIVRHPEKITVKNHLLAVVKADILRDKVDKLVKGHDAVISAYNPGWDNPDIYNEQINGAWAIISGVKKSGVKRLLVVGGAGSLEIAPGVQLLDKMDAPDQKKGGPLATRETLYMLRKEKNLDWTFLSPPLRVKPGERTGRYQVGKDQLLKDKRSPESIKAAFFFIALRQIMDEKGLSYLFQQYRVKNLAVYPQTILFTVVQEAPGFIVNPLIRLSN